MRPLRCSSLVAALAFVACGWARPRSGGEAGDLCTRCHGDPTQGDAAPPRSVSGLVSTDAVEVGAHQRHLQDGLVRKAIACSECHVVPATVDAPGHMGNEHAVITFGALATADGASPLWQRGPATCSSTYCHGATLGAGGSYQTPVWTRVDGAQITCDACHGAPPPPPHPAVSASTTGCGSCHPETVKPDGSIDVAAGKHIDGTVEVGGRACTSCHGDANRTGVPGADALVQAAPPVDTQGNTSTSAQGVGAHQAHVNKASGALGTPIACSACHVVPTSGDHPSGTLNVTFGAKARTGGTTPTWNGASCAATYCHGAFVGGSGGAPSWTGDPMTCTSCHGDPPSTGQHRNGEHDFSCDACHGTGYSSTSVNPSLHVNGAKDVGGAGSLIVSWSKPSCTPQCHRARSW